MENRFFRNQFVAESYLKSKTGKVIRKKKPEIASWKMFEENGALSS